MSYASISEWIYNINPEWNVSVGFSLDDLWSKPEKLTLECISTFISGIRTWNKNNNSPRLTVEARVAAKRQNTTHG